MFVLFHIFSYSAIFAASMWLNIQFYNSVPTDRNETHAVVDSNIQAPSKVFSFLHCLVPTDHRCVMHLRLTVLGTLQIMPLLLLLSPIQYRCIDYRKPISKAPIRCNTDNIDIGDHDIFYNGRTSNLHVATKAAGMLTGRANIQWALVATWLIYSTPVCLSVAMVTGTWCQHPVMRNIILFGCRIVLYTEYRVICKYINMAVTVEDCFRLAFAEKIKM